MLKYLLTFVTFPWLCYAEPSYIKNLLSSPQIANLAEHPQWRTLLHYHPDKNKSYIVDQDFFLSEHGATKPEEELKSTLQHFFKDPDTKCKYIARYDWLKKELNLDDQKLPDIDCPVFAEWHSLINPHSLKLIFTSAFINNPASAFGHTLLRVDPPGHKPSGSLLSYAVNFSANANFTNALEYAFNGVFGGYYGSFSTLPYYKKVKDYSDLENRDIWEYHLDFSPEEVDFLVKHLWELQNRAFIYYYFDENCSYHLLSLLEVAKPELQLRKKFNKWVVPVDTLKEINNIPSLVKEKTFRPSLSSELKDLLAFTPIKLHDYAKQRSQTESIDPAFYDLSQQEQAMTFDLAYQYLKYKKSKGQFVENAKEFSYELLLERNQIDYLSSEVPMKIPEHSPEQGHGSELLSTGTGLRNDQSFFELNWRPAYHGLLDPLKAHTLGSSISFFDIAMRVYEGATINLDEFNLLDINSLSASDKFFRSWSWKLNTGFKNRLFAPSYDSLVYKINFEFGKSIQLLENALPYILAGANLEFDDYYQRKYLFSPSSSLGVIYHPNESLQAQVDYSVSRSLLSEHLTRHQLKLALAYNINENLTLAFNFTRKKDFEFYFNEFSTNINWFLTTSSKSFLHCFG